MTEAKDKTSSSGDEEEKKRADYDSPWKELLDKFFPQFMEFFFPEAYKQIDWSKGFTFLDKELQTIMKNAQIGRAIVDKLVKVWTLDQKELWTLAHIEIQGEPEKEFERRMFLYNFRIVNKHNKTVATFVILTDSNKNWKPSSYSSNTLLTKINFEFASIKLLDYEDKIEELQASTNPFAMVVIAHLRLHKTKNTPEDRYNTKVELIKLLAQKGYSKEDIRELFRFIDWIINLPKPLEMKFREEVTKIEGGTMPSYVTSVERLAKEEGIEEGKKEGIEEGVAHEQKVILKLLHKRFGSMPTEVEDSVKKLDFDGLESLAEAIFDFANIDDVLSWFKR